MTGPLPPGPAAIAATVPNTLDLIGNTPLVLLRGPSEEAGCEVYGKCEFTNPGASVKDRAALWILRDAEAKGLIHPGGTIVEGTAGNTGIGMALVANAKGYRAIIVMPETQSREKMDTLRALGAELVTVPAAPYKNPGHFVHTSRRLAEETEGAIWATSSTMSPTAAPISRAPRPRSGSRWRGGSMASPAPSAPAARWPASASA